VKIMDASELYDPEFRKLIKSKKPTIIIPVGSIEQHGAHLPITTDSDIVTEIASRLAKKCKFIVFPTISYGISHEHDPLFNISIRDNSYRDFLFVLIRSLDSSMGGLGSIIILNGHHGNVKALNELVETQLIMTKSRCYSYWHFMKHEFDHAGFVETSIMLAISDKVKMKKAKMGLIITNMAEADKEKLKKRATEPGGFPKVAENGVWGDPTNATKKDGEKFLAEIVRNLAKECQS